MAIALAISNSVAHMPYNTICL